MLNQWVSIEEHLEATAVVPQGVSIASVASVLSQLESLAHLQKNKRKTLKTEELLAVRFLICYHQVITL